ncbi:MAG TPA: hypothetical protein VF857_10205 [Spirochaetota bacterium]
MRNISIFAISIAFLIGFASCAKLPTADLTSALNTMAVVTDDTATKLQAVKNDKEASDVLISHAENMKAPMLTLFVMQKKFSSMKDSDEYKQGRAKVEEANKRMYAALDVILKKYPNSHEILTAYGKMESIIKDAQESVSKK